MNWVMIPVVPVVSFVRLHEGESTNVLRRAVVVALLVDGLEGELLAVVESERACDDVSTRLEGEKRRRTLDLGHGARAKVGRVGRLDERALTLLDPVGQLARSAERKEARENKRERDGDHVEMR